MSNKNYKRTLYGCYIGTICQAAAINVPPLLFIFFQRDYLLSAALLGLSIFINFVTEILVDFICSKVGDKFSYKALLLFSHGITVLGFISLGLLPKFLDPFIGLIISAVLLAIGGGLAEVVLSPLVNILPTENKASTMSFLHSFYCWGSVLVIVLSSLLIKVIDDSLWWTVPLIWVVLPLFNFINLATAPIPRGYSEEETAKLSSIFKNKTFILCFIMMVCGGASEMIMSQWSSLFAEKGLGISKVVGDILGPGLFAVFMGLGRMLHGMFSEKINLKKALTYLSALAIICYATVVFIPNPFVSLLACAITGLGVSLMWPGTLTITASDFPTGGTPMFAILALAGDLGCASGPFVTGLITDAAKKMTPLLDFAARFGIDNESAALRVGILFGIIFPITSFIILITKRNKNKETK